MKRTSNKTYFLLTFSLTFSVVLLSACAIYLSPLKYINFIAPEPREVDPVAFWADYQGHPDQYLFLDVRNSEVYDRSHAKGALSQPIGTFYDIRYSLPKTGKKIVLICTSGRLAAVAYGFLQDWGYTNLLHVKGGLQAWVLDDLPIEGSDIYAALPTRD